jgi:hypothetical protein
MLVSPRGGMVMVGERRFRDCGARTLLRWVMRGCTDKKPLNGFIPYFLLWKLRNFAGGGVAADSLTRQGSGEIGKAQAVFGFLRQHLKGDGRFRGEMMADVLMSDIDGTLVDSNALHAEAWRI